MKKLTIVTLLVAAISFSSFGQTPNVTSSDINYWVGSGSNEAIFVAYLCHEDAGNAYAWGYRWSGSTPTVENMLRDIDADDNRLAIKITSWMEEIVYTGAGTNDDCSGMWIYLVNGSWVGGIQTQMLQNGDIVAFSCSMCSWGDLDQVNIISVDDPNIYHTVTASSNANGTISPSGDSPVREGTNVKYTFSADYGYKLDSVLLDEADITDSITNNSYTITNVTSAMTIRAVFKAMEQYTVTASSNANGTISPSGDSIVWEGEYIGYYFAANSGCFLDSLILDETENIVAQLQFNTFFLLDDIQSNHTLRAVFTDTVAQPTFTIHAGLGDEWASQLYGTISPVGDSTVVAGSSITYSFTPNAGYRLGSLTLGGVEKIQDVVDNTYTVSNIREDNTLWALFAIDGNNTVTADDIVYWVGEGDNEVIFAVNWCESEMAFAWGYRFSGEKVLVSKVMDDIKAVDSRFDYDAPGGYVGDISYTDDTYNLTTVTGEYWAYNINEASAAAIGSQYVFDGDVIEFGGTSCGLTDDFWNNVWTTAITAVSVPETIGIASRENTTVNVSIYPNPTTDYTSISINGIAGIVSMKITDINGKIIRAEQFQVNDSAVKRIETNVFAKGIYFIHLQNKDVVETRKLIVY